MPAALVAARAHAVLVARPRSSVFHAYTGPITPSGRTSRGVRPVCEARTRPLLVLERLAAALDLAGRRICARCSARLSATARRAEQPPNRLDDRARFFAGLSIDDLLVAVAIAGTVDDTYAVGLVANQLHGRVPTITRHRPDDPAAADRFDLEVAIIRRRDHLRVAGLTPEQRAARDAAHAAETERSLRAQAERRKAAAMDRAIDRANTGRYLTRRDRELAAAAGIDTS